MLLNSVTIRPSDSYFFLMIRRPPRSTPLYSSAASDVYKRQGSILDRSRIDPGSIQDRSRSMGPWALGPMGPWAPWAHGPMGPWAHGPMGLDRRRIDPGSIQDRSRKHACYRIPASALILYYYIILYYIYI